MRSYSAGTYKCICTCVQKGSNRLYSRESNAVSREVITREKLPTVYTTWKKARREKNRDKKFFEFNNVSLSAVARILHDDENKNTSDEREIFLVFIARIELCDD